MYRWNVLTHMRRGRTMYRYTVRPRLFVSLCVTACVQQPAAIASTRLHALPNSHASGALSLSHRTK